MAARKHISLIAKGPIKNVRRAASRHGIATQSCRVVGTGKFGDVQCYASCSPSMNRKIVDWFSEKAGAKNGRGFPPGTLLYHGAMCAASGLGRRRTRRR